MNRPQLRKPDNWNQLPAESRYILEWLCEVDDSINQHQFDGMCTRTLDHLMRDVYDTCVDLRVKFVPFEEAEKQKAEQIAAKFRKARRKKERAEKPQLLYVVFVVIGGKLHRQEYWGRPGRDGKFQPELDDFVGGGELIHRLPKESMIYPRPPIPCGKRVMINGEQRTSALVAHEIMTGERVRNLPRDKGPSKPYRARIYINGRLTHIGYYATPEERDAVQAMAKIGIYPPGFEE